MLCRMPVVRLPNNLSKELEESESGKIDNEEGPGVATYVTSDGRVRADFYIGLTLDGFKLYQNLSSVDPGIKMQFALPPVITCQSDVLTFKPSEDDVITITVVILSRCICVQGTHICTTADTAIEWLQLTM